MISNSCEDVDTLCLSWSISFVPDSWSHRRRIRLSHGGRDDGVSAVMVVALDVA